MFFRTIMLCCFQKTQRLRAAFGYLHFVVLSTPNTLLMASTEEKVNMKHPITLGFLHFLLLHFLCPDANGWMRGFCLFNGGEKMWRTGRQKKPQTHTELSVGVVQSLWWLAVCLSKARPWSHEPQQHVSTGAGRSSVSFLQGWFCFPDWEDVVSVVVVFSWIST